MLNTDATRIIFMGTAELACASLSALHQDPALTITQVVTQPDRPRGRRLQLQPSPVKALAQEMGLTVWQPAKARDPNFVEDLKSSRPDLIVVAAYGQILPRAILDLPPMGCLNVHTSLLPRHRGAAPIQAALLNDDAETGVTIMQMDEGLDTGDILSQRTTPINPEDDAASLHDRLAQLGAQLLIETIHDARAGQLNPQPQPVEGASYAGKITREDGLLDWDLPARTLWNRIRAFTPWPGAFTYWTSADGNRKRLKIWKTEPVQPTAPTSEHLPGTVLETGKEGILIRCHQGNLRILSLQPDNGKQMRHDAFLRGHPMKPGDRLGADES